jgi:pimeloyl-ACP methyl ester carboxylesterase
MDTTCTLLLISGAGLPPSIWDPAIAQLDDLRAVVAPRSDVPRATLHDHVDAALAAAPAGPLVLVAHSAGGVLAAAIAARAPERVAGIVGVAAVVPAAGRSFLASMPFPARLVLDLVMRVAGTRPPAAAVRSGVAAGLDDEAAARLAAAMTAESPSILRQAAPGIPEGIVCGAILTRDDRELSWALQERSANVLGATWREELSAGHLPMVEVPTVFAAAITAFLQHVGCGAVRSV